MGKPCPHCNHSGNCKRCNGNGFILGFISDVKCSICHGTGKCQACNGTGEML